MEGKNLIKIYGISIFFGLIFFLLLVPGLKAADSPDFNLSARSALLMEYETGKIIYKKNIHKKLPPASMTKIMTMLLVMEAVEKGRISLNDKIVASQNAAGMGGSQIWLESGEKMTLRNMMKAIAIASANDACVAVAEYLYGTESNFIDHMNEKTKALGLENTYFHNTNGLPTSSSSVQGNYTTAADMAVMARELLKYPQVLEWTSTWIDHLRNGESVLNNTNWMVRHYPGCDGLKTGYTYEAQHCITSTAKREDLRFIAVIMGAETSQKRFDEAARLLNYGFNVYENYKVLEAGEVIHKINIKNARVPKTEVMVKDSLRVPIKKGEEDNLRKQIDIMSEIKAPLKPETVVGDIKIFNNDSLLKKGKLIIEREVKKASIWQRMFRFLTNII